jgi:hypothetical protein
MVSFLVFLIPVLLSGLVVHVQRGFVVLGCVLWCGVWARF